MNLAIETQSLSKSYGRVKAVEDLSLCVGQGEIYAFLGLNGAGKTTTIRLLLGMIRPTAGQVIVLSERIRPGGCSPWASVGYLVETARAYPELSVRENLEVQRRLHPGTPASAVVETIERLGLAPYADRRAGTLSLGNLQRLGLAKALLHNPALLILDEPANGLDPAGIVEIRELLRGLAQDRGVTVFMSSHILAEVARLATRIGIIHQGRLVRELDAAALERERIHRLRVSARDLIKTADVLRSAQFHPEALAGEEWALRDPAAIQAPEMVATLLVQANCAPTRLWIEQEDLESYFLRLVNHSAEGQPV